MNNNNETTGSQYVIGENPEIDDVKKLTIAKTTATGPSTLSNILKGYSIDEMQKMGICVDIDWFSNSSRVNRNDK